MKHKNIEQVLKMPPSHFVGDGFKVHTFFPSHSISMQRMNPFLMMDYNAPHYFPPTSAPRGVDVHPHKGFETVTIAYKGKIAHHDSVGNSGIIAEGDVQWMTAAAGILHKEYHEKSFSETGGILHMVQLWVNLPAAYKLSAPKYQEISHANIPGYSLEDGSRIEIIAGHHKGTKGIAETFSEVHLMNAYLKTGSAETFHFSLSNNTAILIINGKVNINNETEVTENEFVLFKNDGEIFEIKAQEESVILILSAAALNEPIAAHGPFVMNTREEIIEAFEEYNSGKYGTVN